MAEKKNIDYSASAVNLVNPPSVGMLLKELQIQQANLEILRRQADGCIPQTIKSSITAIGLDITITRQSIEKAIGDLGSYQDLDAGLYGIKQCRISVNYDPVRFRSCYPQFAPAVIIEAVDEGKVKGLIKGGLLDIKKLLSEEVVQEKESYRFIIEAKGEVVK